MSEKVTEKSTKKQILSAYESAVKEVRRLRSERLNPQEEARKVRKDEVDDATKPERVEESVTALKAFSASIPNAIRGFVDEVNEQIEQLRELDGAIAFRKKELDDLYGIAAEAESLAALVESHKTLEAELEEEIARTRKAWEEEQEEHGKVIQRNTLDREQDLARRQSEWHYEFERRSRHEQNKLEDELAERRKKFQEDLDLANKQLRARLEDLDKRQADLAEREAKTEELEQQIERLKATREQETEVAALAAKDRAKASYNIELNAIRKSHEAEVTVLTAKNETLAQQLADLRDESATLSAKLNEAYGKIQDVAIKSLESQGNSKMVELSRSMASEPRQGKN